MKLLIVSATSIEIEPLLSFLGKGRAITPNLSRFRNNRWQIDVLITGVGMVATTFWTTLFLSKHKYDACLNIGICGSFNKAFTPGTVLNVMEDSFPEKGAESGELFLSLVDLKLIERDEFPFTGGKLINNPGINSQVIAALPKVRAITVNTVHGNDKSIAQLLLRTNADIETMEGAAFFYSVFQFNIPCLQIRSVSNFVEKRDSSKWNIPLAIRNLNEEVIRLLNE